MHKRGAELSPPPSRRSLGAGRARGAPDPRNALPPAKPPMARAGPVSDLRVACPQERPVEVGDWRKNVEAMSGMEGRKKMFDAAKSPTSQ